MHAANKMHLMLQNLYLIGHVNSNKMSLSNLLTYCT